MTNLLKISLAKAMPKRLDLPVLIGVSFVGLVVAYCLPFMEISKLIFFSDDYTLLSSIGAMWEEGYILLGLVIFGFSVLFPMLKLVSLFLVWCLPVTVKNRNRLIFWLGILGKWSMLDVFVVALIVLMTQSKALVGAEPRSGLYLFGASVLVSMLATLMVERAARKI